MASASPDLWLPSQFMLVPDSAGHRKLWALALTESGFHLLTSIHCEPLCLLYMKADLWDTLSASNFHVIISRWYLDLTRSILISFIIRTNFHQTSFTVHIYIYMQLTSSFNNLLSDFCWSVQQLFCAGMVKVNVTADVFIGLKWRTGWTDYSGKLKHCLSLNRQQLSHRLMKRNR